MCVILLINDVYNQCCDILQIKREIERSFSVRFDVKSDTIACKGTPRQRNKIKIDTIMTTKTGKVRL